MSTVGIDVNFATLMRVIHHIIDQAKPVLIRGRHGCGKSEMVYSIVDGLYYNSLTNEVSTDTNGVKLTMVERRASQMTEGDLVGLPSIMDNSTQFNPPDWFKLACDKPCGLFLDEIDRATIEVRQGIFELTDSRKLNGFHLHPGTRIFAAVNGGKHAQQYQVGEMDPAELDRWSVFDVEPTVEDWLNWANGKVHSVVWDFINQNHVQLEHKDEFEPNKKYPSRRSWKRASDVLTKGKFLDSEHNPDIIPISNAFVGFEAAVSFSDFVRNYKKQVSPDDILVRGRLELVKDFTLNEHIALIEKMKNLDSLNKKITADECKNIGQYFVSLPSEAAMKLFKVLSESGPKENCVFFFKSEIDVDSVDEQGNKTGLKEKLMIKNFMVKLLGPMTAQKNGPMSPQNGPVQKT